MVAEPWIYRVGTQLGSNLKHALSLDHHHSISTTAVAKMKESSKPPPDPYPAAAAKKANTVGILSFEVASAMSKAVHLHKSLSGSEVSRLRNEVLRSHAIRHLVSADEARLLELVVAEKLDDLNRVAAVVSRLGRRCTEQALVGFQHVYADLLNGRVDVGKLGFLVKDMGGTIKKMERYVSSTASLYGELEVLNELEQGAKKLYLTQHQPEDARRAYEQKLQCQRHEVKHLRDASLWNQTYDKVVGLMARAVCTIYARVRQVFGEFLLPVETPTDVRRQLSSQILPGRHRTSCAGLVQPNVSQRGPAPAVPIPRGRRVAALPGESLGFHCGSSPGRLFLECLNLSSPAPWKDEVERLEFGSESCSSKVGMSIPFSAGQIPFKRGRRPQFGPKGVSTTMRAPPSTVGGSALALHYANVIIIIEKLLRYPHLVGEEARDDLYQMLPTSLRVSLRRTLKSYVKDLAIYDAPVAHDWKGRLDKILAWLSPMAHDMIKWQTERNFEQQQIVSRANVLLLQTLYYADRERTEVAVCELLVGLNYICRYEHQQNALLDCTSSLDFDECTDWHLEH
uniref:Putative oxaloacetate decarboxylase gamma chain n=1 Tax=Anthurium amnicola TaxID=1678845 RepID=A0A1D1XMY4_9ARAE